MIATRIHDGKKVIITVMANQVLIHEAQDENSETLLLACTLERWEEIKAEYRV